MATLRAAPFNLVDLDSVTARVTAVNAIGDSVLSSEGSGANIPIPPTEPDVPTSLIKDSAS